MVEGHGANSPPWKKTKIKVSKTRSKSRRSELKFDPFRSKWSAWSRLCCSDWNQGRVPSLEKISINEFSCRFSTRSQWSKDMMRVIFLEKNKSAKNDWNLVAANSGLVHSVRNGRFGRCSVVQTGTRARSFVEISTNKIKLSFYFQRTFPMVEGHSANSLPWKKTKIMILAATNWVLVHSSRNGRFGRGYVAQIETRVGCVRWRKSASMNFCVHWHFQRVPNGRRTCCEWSSVKKKKISKKWLKSGRSELRFGPFRPKWSISLLLCRSDWKRTAFIRGNQHQ